MYDTGHARQSSCAVALACSLIALAGCPAGSNPTSCPSGQALCGTACVDTSSSVAHCGSCTVTCASGQLCAGGSCACPAKSSLCGSACVDLSADVANCGTCGRACNSGQTCTSGQCGASCTAPSLQCAAGCVNPATDASNCGACAHACASGESCSAGQCTPICSSGTTLCAGACVDTGSDALDCGSCGHACAAGQVCNAGSCAATCTAPSVQCGSACVNTSGDVANCGSCGHACATGQTCSGGQCVSAPGPDAGTALCGACLSSADCPASAACVQIGGEDSCAAPCQSQPDCTSDQICLTTTALSGAQVQVCVPKIGSCNGAGCGTCTAGESCDTTIGQCVPDQSAPDAGPASEACGTLIGPDVAAGCTSCKRGGSNCQTNGCYGGWWCDSSTNRCQKPPTSCPSSGYDAGVQPAGQDAGPAIPLDAGQPVTGTVGPTGGTVSHLYFAVTGDTRPGNQDETATYPTAIIQKIFQDVNVLSPRPEFFLATGDFMFASTSASATAQLQLYLSAMQQYSGTIFPVMGNHECNGYTADNCSGMTTPNMTAYTSLLLTPLGLQLPYYSVPISAQDGSWTAKLIVAACNDWDSTQQSWLAGELAKATTYTIVARHEPSSTTNAPCVSQMDAMLSQSKYDLLLVGHTHAFSHSGKQVVVGIGGAPLTGGGNYGFATVEQASSGFKVTQYDYSTALPVQSFVVPY